MFTSEPTIAEVPAGTIVETIHFGMPSGNLYMAGDPPVKGVCRRTMWRRFNQGKTMVHCENHCRIIENSMMIDGF